MTKTKQITSNKARKNGGASKNKEQRAKRNTKSVRVCRCTDAKDGADI